MENSNLSTEKSFDSSVEELYHAWTNENALKQWWKPGGRNLKSVEAGLNEGGTIKYTFEAVNDSLLVVDGIYKEVAANEKLVYTWNWNLENAAVEDGKYTLTVNFEKDGDGSKITVHQDKDAEEEGIHPNSEGWDQALKDLEIYLASSK